MNKPFSGSFPISQSYGETLTNPAGHSGIDYALYLGTAVLAADDGQVTLTADEATGYGKMVLLNHSGGLQTRYAHLSQVSVTTGQRVKQGELLGYSGSSGNSTGPHLHFEVIRDGVTHDPQLFLQPEKLIDSALQWRVKVDQLYVRSGPGIEHQIVDSLHKGELIAEYECSQTVWLRIGPERWTAASYKGVDFCEQIS